MLDHVYLYLGIPPKYSVANTVEFLKGKSAIRCIISPAMEGCTMGQVLHGSAAGHRFRQSFSVVTFGNPIGRQDRCTTILNQPVGTIAALLGCILLAACSTQATTTANYVPPATAMAALPRPIAVVVEDFAVDSNAVSVDQGIGGRLRRDLTSMTDSSAQTRDAKAVRLGIADTLTQAIRRMGLPAQKATGQLPAAPYVEVRGQVHSINEGNRTRRTLVGFGAGQSNVSAMAQVTYVAPGAEPRLLQTYTASSNSGHMPGLGVGAAGAAAGHAVAAAANGGLNVANAGRADVGAEAKRLGARLAVNIGKLFAEQGWIPQSAVPRPSLR